MSDNPCSGCKKLCLVPTPPPEPEARNFWNTCPRKLDSMPESACKMGKPVKKRGRVVNEPACPWWVDSAEHHYCFWKYVQAESDPAGKMDALLQNEIARKYGCSSTKIHFVVKDGIQKLKEAGSLSILSELASEEASGGAEEMSLPRSLGLRPEFETDVPEES